MADGAYGQPAGRLQATFATREFAPRILNAIRDNLYRDSVRGGARRVHRQKFAHLGVKARVREGVRRELVAQENS